jgi:fumarylpyruvate hydrolase
MDFVFPPPPPVFLPIAGDSRVFPVRRIFCVGRNYAEHAREMGAPEQADGREPPFFFSKPADALVGGSGELSVAYPGRTANLQHEVELVIALAQGGSDLTPVEADDCIWAYAVGLDLTRRDLQARAKEKGHPWDMSKGFDQSAVAAPLRLRSEAGPLDDGRIWLTVNGELRQDGRLAQMSWRAPEVVANLSSFVTLAPGDLIYTGTPAGVGTLVRGDRIEAGIDGLPGLVARMV